MAIQSCSTVPIIDSLPPLRELGTPEEQLETIRLVTLQAIAALSAFRDREYSKFDAIVGDQACQFRALKVAEMSRQDFLVDTELTDCQRILDQIERIKAVYADFAAEAEREKRGISEELRDLGRQSGRVNTDRKECLQGIGKKDPKRAEISTRFRPRFDEINRRKGELQEERRLIEQDYIERMQRCLERENLSLSLDSDAQFLVNAYFLTIVKDSRPCSGKYGDLDWRDHSTASKLKLEGTDVRSNILNASLDKIYKIAKAAMLRLSIEFIQAKASALDDQSMVDEFASPYFNAKKKQEELPFFFGVQTVFQRAMQLELPIVLKVRNRLADPLSPNVYQASMLLKPDGKGDFVPVEIDARDLESAAIVIKCRGGGTCDTSYLPEVLGRAGSFLQMLQMDAAQHCQFTDQESNGDEMFDPISGLSAQKKAELIQLKDRAIREGFSDQNSSVCCIEHIFCDVVKNQFEQEEVS